MSRLVGEQRDVWCLTGHIDGTSTNRCVPIETSPFRIGRQTNLELTLMSATVSSIHAEIVMEETSLWIRDLNSTNGTRVNGMTVTDKRRLQERDLIQIANFVFRVRREAAPLQRNTEALSSSTFDEAFSLVQFDKLINETAVIPHFQPIVLLPDQTTVAYEVLGRSPIVGLQMPKDMFIAAAHLDLEEELSQMLRLVGLQDSATISQSAGLYFQHAPSRDRHVWLARIT